jgi:hypothetical protein
LHIHKFTDKKTVYNEVHLYVTFFIKNPVREEKEGVRFKISWGGGVTFSIINNIINLPPSKGSLCRSPKENNVLESYLVMPSFHSYHFLGWGGWPRQNPSVLVLSETRDVVAGVDGRVVLIVCVQDIVRARRRERKFYLKQMNTMTVWKDVYQQ